MNSLKMFTHRRGLSDLVFYIMGYFIGLVMIIGLFTILFFSVFKGSAETYHMEHYLYSSRVLLSSDSVFYADPDTHRLYPWIVDPDKLRTEQIASLFEGEPEFAAAVSVRNGFPVGINHALYDAGAAVYLKGGRYFGGTQLQFPVLVNQEVVPLRGGVMFKR